MSVNAFDVLKTMSERDLDIRLTPDENFISADMRGGYGEVKIGVPPQLIMDLAAGKSLTVRLLVWDIKQFAELEAELNGAEP